MHIQVCQPKTSIPSKLGTIRKFRMGGSRSGDATDTGAATFRYFRRVRNGLRNWICASLPDVFPKNLSLHRKAIHQDGQRGETATCRDSLHVRNPDPKRGNGHD